MTKIREMVSSYLLVTLMLLCLSCSGGGSSSDTVLANAGADQDAVIDELVSLDGLASTGVTSISWTLSTLPDGSGATLTDADTLEPSFTPDVSGVYVATLSINDGASTDDVTITVTSSNVDITIPADSLITTRERLGVTEYVVDAEAAGATLEANTSNAGGATLKKVTEGTTCLWAQKAGPTATIADAASCTLSFTAPGVSAMLNQSDAYKWQVLPISRNDTKMTFQVTITNADASIDTDTIDIYLQDDGSEIHTSSGLTNVGIGTKVYLAGPSQKSSSLATTDWAWTLTVPEDSSATFTGGGTTSTLQVPSFIPDVEGIYTVAYSSTTGNTTASTPTAKTPGTLLINAASYVGIGNVGGTSPVNPQCATCHDGTPLSDLEDVVAEYDGTRHAGIFEDNMDTYKGLAPEPYLWQYHTVGFNKDAANDGFDDLATDASFTFPEAGMTFDAFTTDNPTVAKLANVQCENCHGPGSQHEGDPLRIGKSFSNAGVCGQCHVEEDQWKTSKHNSYASSATAGWLTNKVCTKCHISKGFNTFIEGGQTAEVILTGDADAFGGVTCVACHDPHDATNSYQLRFEGDVVLDADGGTVSAGKAAVCYKCHMGNREIDEADCDSDADGVADTACLTFDQTATQYAGGGYHDTPQGTMLEGIQMLEDLDGDATNDMNLNENSFHSSSSFTLAAVTGNPDLEDTNNKCVTCHMATAPTATQDGYQEIGGHAFAMIAADGTEQTAACTPCHGSKLTEFNRLARADYDGDGTIEGIQDEVKGLMVNLTTLIKSKDTVHINQNTDVILTSATTGTSGSYVVTTPTATEAAGDIHAGTISYNGATTTLTAGTKCSTKTSAGIWTSTSATGFRACNFNATSATLRRAIWNLNSAKNDESFGIHNAAYFVQTLQQTYSALRIKLDAKASTWTYKDDFPNATIR